MKKITIIKITNTSLDIFYLAGGKCDFKCIQLFIA